MEKPISVQNIINHPVFEKIIAIMKNEEDISSSVDLESKVKLPYIIKEKILMSPGVWNGYYYSPEEIKLAFENTNWEDKDVRALYLDHLDGTNGKMGSLTWVGEVLNIKMSGENLVGDLVVIDKPTAIKLAYGAKMGISPKVHGDDDEGQMRNFFYDNFSVVINPAVKTAYINNSQKEESVDNKKPYGDVSYADPGYQKDGMSRYPLDTEKHVKSAWSYINMPKNKKFYSEEQLDKIMNKIKQAAKRFDIEISEQEMSEDNQNNSELIHYDTYITMLNYSNEHGEIIPEELFFKSLAQDIVKYQDNYYSETVGSVELNNIIKENQEETKMTDEVKIEETVTEAPAEVKESTESKVEEVKETKVDEVKSENAEEKVSNEMSSIVSILEEIKKELSANSQAIKEMKEAEKPKVEEEKKEESKDESKDESKEDEKKVEQKMSEQIDKRDILIQEMSDKIKELESKINEPIRSTVKTVEMSQRESVDKDAMFLETLRATN